jgi:hypothetical protein
MNIQGIAREKSQVIRIARTRDRAWITSPE